MNRKYMMLTVLVSLGVFGFLVRPVVAQSQENSLEAWMAKLNEPANTNPAELIAVVRRIGQENIELRKQLNLRSAPVGTVSAYAGAPNRLPVGWRLCNGDPMDRSRPENESLFQAIQYAWGGSGNTFHLPDLRGRFLRGVDMGKQRDPEAKAREASYPGGASGDAVGSFQPQATRRPKAAFSIAGDGAHSHSLDLETTAGREDGTQPNTVAYPFAGKQRIETGGGGNHSHDIKGGDVETRPDNVAVHWIIKVVP